jgi:hypothetical protein
MRRRTRRTALAACLVGLLTATPVLAGCGGDDHANEPRPPAPIELTARVDDRGVELSPTEDTNGNPIGAGLATITIANLTDDEVQLGLSGPSSGTSDPIVARGVGSLKIDLEEGDYEVTSETTDARPDSFAVGPPRPSAQNELLLP